MCLLLLAVAMATGCPGPGRQTCETDEDCFEGEICDPDRRICVPSESGPSDTGAETGTPEPDVGDATNGDVDPPPDDSSDDDADGDSDETDDECDRESDLEFCRRHEVECGEYIGADNCGDQRKVNCGEFEGFGCPGLGTCRTEDDLYECVCPDVDFNQADLDICIDLDLECGEFVPGERCRGWEGEGYESVDCGSCQPNGDCGRETPNQCGCDCMIDDRCYLEGDTKVSNPCKVCDPDRATDSFSNVSGGSACGENDRGTCVEEGGVSFCQCPRGNLLCEGACIDPATNDSHCGECGNVCFDDTTCQEGECR